MDEVDGRPSVIFLSMLVLVAYFGKEAVVCVVAFLILWGLWDFRHLWMPKKSD